MFSGYLKEFVSLLDGLHVAGKLMQESRKLVAAAKCAQDFSSVTSVFEVIKQINSQVVELKLDYDSQEDEVDDTALTTSEPEASSGENDKLENVRLVEVIGKLPLI